MTDNLAHEFFTEVKGWKSFNNGTPRNPIWVIAYDNRVLPIPPISTSWDAFHKWVRPELPCNAQFQKRIGECFFIDKTPQLALEWVMEELGR